VKEQLAPEKQQTVERLLRQDIEIALRIAGLDEEEIQKWVHKLEIEISEGGASKKIIGGEYNLYKRKMWLSAALGEEFEKFYIHERSHLIEDAIGILRKRKISNALKGALLSIGATGTLSLIEYLATSSISTNIALVILKFLVSTILAYEFTYRYLNVSELEARSAELHQKMYVNVFKGIFSGARDVEREEYNVY